MAMPGLLGSEDQPTGSGIHVIGDFGSSDVGDFVTHAGRVLVVDEPVFTLPAGELVDGIVVEDRDVGGEEVGAVVADRAAGSVAKVQHANAVASRAEPLAVDRIESG